MGCLKVSAGLNAGNTFSFDLTYISHGTGSSEEFAPVIYTSNNTQFFNEDGTLNANWACNCAGVGNEWETNTINWNVSPQAEGDNWIWIYAPESSGLILNICQVDLGEIEYGIIEPIHICEGESVTIGEDFGQGTSYSWTNGSNESEIDVSASNVYFVEASNNCNSAVGSYSVVVNDEPQLLPPLEEVLLCAEDTMQITSIGLNVENMWPDGSTDSTWTITEEGIFEIFLEDDCAAQNIVLTVDYDTIPYVELGPDIALCEGQTTTLDATAIGWSDVVYEWSTGITEPLQEVLHQNTYTVTLTNDCGSYSDSIFVEYSLLPDSVLPDGEIFLCTGLDYLFDVSAIDAASITWSDGTDGQTLLTEYTGTYWVEILDDDYCWVIQDTAWVVDGNCECPLYLPNAFTPDYDGLNDTFIPIFECLPYDFKMEIFDRWGVTVYRTQDAFQGWNGLVDGVHIPQSTYHWRIWYRESYDGIPIEKFGSVTVIGHPYGER